MKNFRQIEKHIFYVGASDYKSEKFENHIPIPGGMAYNSYLLVDEKTVLFDAVDASLSEQFLKNVEEVLLENKKGLDFVVVTHMEPDHSSALEKVLEKYPEATVVYNKKTQTMFSQYFDLSLEGRELIVSEGDKLKIGEHLLEFFMAPMVHWPEVMMCFEHSTGVLFTADAFGSFGSLSGNLFDREVVFDEVIISEYRRYYTNIVGKYGPQVLKAMEKASRFNIKKILPLHGYILEKEISRLLSLYSHWASYEPEEKGVLIIYASMYDHTKLVALSLAASLKEAGIQNVRAYDVSAQDASYLVSESFRYSDIVLASVTHNNNIYILMEEFLSALVAANLQNRSFYFIENGTWAPISAKLMREKISVLKNCKLSEKVLTIKSSFKSHNEEAYRILLDEIVVNNNQK